jgi:hypothetical protein
MGQEILRAALKLARRPRPFNASRSRKYAHAAAHGGETTRAGTGRMRARIGSRDVRLLTAGLARSPAGVFEWGWTSKTMHRTFAFGFFFFFPRPLAEGPG